MRRCRSLCVVAVVAVAVAWVGFAGTGAFTTAGSPTTRSVAVHADAGPLRPSVLADSAGRSSLQRAHDAGPRGTDGWAFALGVLVVALALAALTSRPLLQFVHHDRRSVVRGGAAARAPPLHLV
jgi:hypothetical protein